jgi:hypothetical protein
VEKERIQHDLALQLRAGGCVCRCQKTRLRTLRAAQ